MMALQRIRTRTKDFLHRNERYLTSGAFLLGFIVDNLTLTRIDLLFDNLVLFFYLSLAIASIVLMNAADAGKLRGTFVGKISPWFILTMQYAFGGLYSGFFIYYSRSGVFVTSWIFLVFLAGLLIGNEVFKDKYRKFEFQISLFFLSLFSFLIFYVPVVVNEIGPRIFMVSGLLSLCGIFLFIALLAAVFPARVKKTRRTLAMSIGGIFAVLNLLYFTNIIPPVPLSLKEEGVYHNVERTVGGGYRMIAEETKWYDLRAKMFPVFHQRNGEPVYFFSSVFSPTDLDVSILHSWQYFDEEKGEWVESFRLEYGIFGGRDGGYRGYSIKENIAPGKWRVDVMTERGQLLGRHVFRVVSAEGPVPLVLMER